MADEYLGLEDRDVFRAEYFFQQHDNPQYQRHLLDEHDCVLEWENGFGWVLDDKKGSISLGKITEAEALKCAAMYVHLYFEKEVDFPTAERCAKGFIGGMMTHQEWVHRWQQPEYHI